MRRILVVDDDLSICKALQLGLSSKEVEVDIADNGKSAVELGSQKEYDVVVADMILTEVDGLDVVRRIRTRSPDIVSILITGDPEKTGLAETAGYGVSAYLEKPVDLKTIKAAISRGLEERACQRNSSHSSRHENTGKSEPFQPKRSLKGRR